MSEPKCRCIIATGSYLEKVLVLSNADTDANTKTNTDTDTDTDLTGRSPFMLID